MILHEQGILPEFDDRREVWRLLHRATKRQRVKWLRWCCQQISTDFVKKDVIESSGEVGEVWAEAMSLAFGNGMSVHRAGEKLVEIVKGFDV